MISPPVSNPPVTSTLRTFAAETLGTDYVRLEQLVGGASRLAYLVHRDDHSGPVAFLRVDDGSGGLSKTSFTLEREGCLLQRVARHGLPVPKVFGYLASPPALLMEAVPGGAEINRETAEKVGPEYMQLLARIHDIDPADVLPTASTDGAQALTNDLAWWDALARDGGAGQTPLVVAARRALEMTRPPSEESATFLHGDAGAGNFLLEGGRVTGLLDWEMAHTGDFHEDLAWVCLRTIFTPFGELDRRLREYEAASGRTIDPKRLRWFETFVAWKSLVAIETTLRNSRGEKSDVSELVGVTYRPILAELAERILIESASDVTEVAESLREVAELRAAGDVAAQEVPIAKRVLERTRTEGILS